VENIAIIFSQYQASFTDFPIIDESGQRTDDFQKKTIWDGIEIYQHTVVSHYQPIEKKTKISSIERIFEFI